MLVRRLAAAAGIIEWDRLSAHSWRTAASSVDRSAAYAVAAYLG